MHDDIKRFTLSGTVSSDRLLTTRERLIKEVEDSMRDYGYVPVLDLLPQFTRAFNPESEEFSFELSCYGTYVGEEEECQFAGMMSGILLEKSIRQPK